jgi:hypothetical protein
LTNELCCFHVKQIEVPLEKLIAPAKTNNDAYNVWFNIEHNGSINVQLSENGKMKDVKNHFGDFDTISREFLKNTRLLARFKLGSEKNVISRVHSDNVEIAESFGKLIEYSIDSFNQNGEAYLNKKFKLFQVSQTKKQIIFCE